jgi:TPP-dependent indolepyruvate ferredoxin oxidoreductase alpha subunit
MAETAKKVKTATKRRKSRKVVKDVIFDISEISTAINQIQIKDKKVGIIFQGSQTEYFYNYTEDLSEFVKEIEKFTKEQHISLGKRFNELVRNGTLSEIK